MINVGSKRPSGRILVILFTITPLYVVKAPAKTILLSVCIIALLIVLFAPAPDILNEESIEPSSDKREILLQIVPLNLVKLPNAIVLLSDKESTFKTELSKPTPAVRYPISKAPTGSTLASRP